MTEAAAPIRGLWCATLTPLSAGGRIDHPALAAHARRLFARGVDGIALFGTTGEGPSFSIAERSAGLSALLSAGIPPARLVVATGCAAFTDTVVLTRDAVQSGCPRCLVLPPFFWKGLTDEAVFRYYASLIDAVCDPRLRVYLYHIPQVSAVPIRPPVAARLASAYPDIVAGVKDSGGDFAHTTDLLKSLPQLSILTGRESHLPWLMRAGGAGTICGVANLWPERVGVLLSPDVTPDDEEWIRTVLESLAAFPLVPAFKAIRAAQTVDSGWRTLRPPLLPLTETESRGLLAALRKAGIAFIPENGCAIQARDQSPG